MATARLSVLRGVGSQVGGSAVTLTGEGVVNKGSSYEYKITNFDSFSVYSVESAELIVDIDGDTVSVEVPDTVSSNEVSFTVVKDSSPRVFSLAVGEAGVAKPRIISPQNNSSNQSTSITLQATTFHTIPEGLDKREESQWQVARDEDFTDIVVAIYNNSDSWHVTGLPTGTQLYSRVRYKGETLGWSSWSDVVKFSTSVQSIVKPTISYDGDKTQVGDSPKFNGSAFITDPAGSDSHLSSSWRIEDADGVVWERSRDMNNKTSITIPRGVLKEDSQYSISVKYEGASLGESMWSDKLTFNTKKSFIPDEDQIGVPWEGGYYAGRINVDGVRYAIVLASKQAGGVATGLRWKTSNTTTPNTDSTYNCKANMAGAVAAGINNHPAFKFCYEYRGGGYDDWLLPSIDVVEVIYRNLKPTTKSNTVTSSGGPHGATGRNPNSIPFGISYSLSNPSQTPLAIFKSGGSESIYDSSSYWMWSSTQRLASNAWTQRSDDGNQATFDKTYIRYVRPVRLVRIN